MAKKGLESTPLMPRPSTSPPAVDAPESTPAVTPGATVTRVYRRKPEGAKLKRRVFFANDALWQAVVDRADGDGVELTVVIRRALRAYLGVTNGGPD